MNEHITEAVKKCFYEVFGCDGSGDVSFKTYQLIDRYYGDLVIRFKNKYSDYIIYIGYYLDNDASKHRSHIYMDIDGEYVSIDKFDTKDLVKTLGETATKECIDRFIYNSNLLRKLL